MNGQTERTRAELRRIIRQARRRWRIRTFLRGAAIVAPIALAAVLLASLGLERLAFAPGWIAAFRVLTYLALAAAVARFLVAPQLRRADDARIALYLEEHEPTLEAALVSAVELDGAGGDAGDAHDSTGDPGDGAGTDGPARRPVHPAPSPALLRRLVEQAVERAHAVDDGRWVGVRELRIATSGLLATLAFAPMLFLLGPDFLRHGAAAVLFPWRAAEAAVPYRITVAPGDATVARGSDQRITAWLHGFDAADVALLVRAGDGAGFERLPMASAADSGAFEAFLFDLEEPAEYFVEADGVRSPVHRIDVADLPFTRRLDHEYRFPAYTGLPPRTVEDAADIAALRGTTVRFHVWTTVPAPAGRIVLDDGRMFPLVAGEGTGAAKPGAAPGAVAAPGGVPAPDEVAPPGAATAPGVATAPRTGTAPGGAAGAAAAPGVAVPLVGSIPIDRAGHYRIELVGPDGRWVDGSPRYTVDVLEDQPPSVAFERPGRDTRATAIDEIFLEARAVDDYGIARLELVYSVNGGEERTVRLYEAGGRALREVAAGHTLYLEELELQPGDVVAYFARATDGARAADDPAAGGDARVAPRAPVTSDIYFIRIRPFRRDYRAAEQSGMPGGEAMGGEYAELSERQREIVAATFNLVRDREHYSVDEWAEHVTTVTLAQSRLREEVGSLVSHMRARGILSADSAFEAIVEHLDSAAAAMQDAERRLAAREAQEALPPEQRALQQLQRAEEVYREVRVALGERPAGGGSSPDAEDLADLFELEMDRLRNQYEAVRRGRDQERDAQLDEALERIKELARRHEQAAERQRRLAREQQGAAAGAGADAQRRLAEEVEAEARRLERLAREDPRNAGALEESARRLRDAAQAIRRSAADPSGSGARAAADRLDEARRLLERGRADRLARGAEDAARRAERIAEEQRAIEREVRDLDLPGADPNRVRALMERKDRLEQEVAGLERELDRIAADAAREGLDAADPLRDAAGAIRDEKIKEKIRYSKGVLQAGDPRYAESFERQIAGDVEALRDRVADAARALAEASAEAGREADAIDRARRLARGMETLGERIGERLEEDRAARRLGPPREDASRDPAAAGRPAPLSPDEIRQFRREARERIADAEALRQQLARDGRDVEALSRIIAQMRALDSQRVYADPAEIERLRTQIVEGLKRFEFGLRRELHGDDGRVFIPGAGQVPAGYEEWVAEYYRSLGRGGGGS
ncbi:MAG TPA: hypothetical protein VF158_04050 [Longimicrobiales bacterium]